MNVPYAVGHRPADPPSPRLLRGGGCEISYSWRTRNACVPNTASEETMGDQQLGGNLERDAKSGTSITIERPWIRDDEDEWPEAANWIKEQQERLAAVVRSM